MIAVVDLPDVATEVAETLESFDAPAEAFGHYARRLDKLSKQFSDVAAVLDKQKGKVRVRLKSGAVELEGDEVKRLIDTRLARTKE